MQELEAVLLHPDVDRHFGVPVNCIELAQQHLEVVQELIADPAGTMAVLDESLRLAQEHVVREQQDNSENVTVKVRIAKLYVPNAHTARIPVIRRMCRVSYMHVCMDCLSTWTLTVQTLAQHRAASVRATTANL